MFNPLIKQAKANSSIGYKKGKKIALKTSQHHN